MISILSPSPFCREISDNSFIKNAGEVALSRVRQNCDDCFTLELRQCCQSCSDCYRRTTGNTGQNSFFFGQSPGVFNGFIITDLFNAVNQPEIEVVRDKTGAYPLDLVRARLKGFSGKLLT